MSARTVAAVAALFLCGGAGAASPLSTFAEQARQGVEPTGASVARATPQGAPRAVLYASDVASLYAEEPLRSAMRAFKSGQYRAARAKLAQAEPSLAARALEAQLLAKLGDDAAAAQAFGELGESDASMQDVWALERGRALQRSRQLEAAAQAYAEVEATSSQFAAAKLAEAGVLARLGDLDGAERALISLLQGGALEPRSEAAAQVWTRLARLAATAKDREGERAAWLATWALHPKTPSGERAKAKVPSPAPPAWKVARADVLLSMHLNLPSLELLRTLPRSLTLPDPTACRAQFLIGTAWRKERKHALAVQALTEVVERCDDPVIRPRALYVLGYSQAVIDPERAVLTYERLAREHPAHPFADDALFFAAETLRRTGNIEGARRDLDLLVARYPEADYAAEALFLRFWDLRGRGEGGNALLVLDQLEAMPDPVATAEDKRRARYWRARTLEELGEEDAAAQLLGRLATREACTYYGLISRSLLATRGDLPEEAPGFDGRPAPIWPLEAGPLLADARFREALALLRHERREAGTALMAVVRRFQGSEGLRALSHVLLSGNLKKHAGVASRDFLRAGFSVPSSVEARALHEAAYPNTFRPLVVRQSKLARVDPDLMQALIRMESGFNPRARSATGALGLAQLMPETAAQVARSIRMVTSAQALLQPRHNIQLGARYLGQLHRRFDGNSTLAVASYNAGPGAVRRWLSRSPDLELDEFVEEIPVEETRNYTKHVLAGYGAYRFLYESKPKASFALKLAGR